MGAGVLLHAKLGRTLCQGDVLFTLFAEVGGSTTTPSGGTRRVIETDDVDVACRRLFKAFKFGNVAAAPQAAKEASSLIRCFVGRDGTVTRIAAP